jgi:nicotinamide phosphoribosyltransferase
LTPTHRTPGDEVVWILEQLWKAFGGTSNPKGYRVLDPHVGVLWGDGLNPDSIDAILAATALHSFSAENLVFGMGGGLLQKGIDRDMQRFAFKASAMRREGDWYDVQKVPLDRSKASKAGRLALVERDGGLVTVRRDDDGPHDLVDRLLTVFEDGELFNEQPFADVRDNARGRSRSASEVA